MQLSPRSGTNDVIFVTGGSGFLGINLIRALLERGLPVLLYDLLPFEYPERDRVRAIIGDIRDRAALAKAMAGSTLVVHSAAALPSYSADEIMSTEVQGTANVLDAAAELGIPRVVHISSTAIYGKNTVGTAEDAAFEFFGPYSKAKVLAEEQCQRARDRGMCVPILRPKTFIGPERLGIWAILYDWAYSGCGFPLIGSGNNRYQLLDVDDLCDVIETTMFGPVEIVNDTFNVGAKEFGTMKSDFQAVLDHAGHGKSVRSIPAGPLIACLKLLERLKLSPVYEWVYETASADSYVSIEKAERVLGFSPAYSNVDALIRNYEWYVRERPAILQRSGVSHRAAWKQGIIGLGRYFF